MAYYFRCEGKSITQLLNLFSPICNHDVLYVYIGQRWFTDICPLALLITSLTSPVLDQDSPNTCLCTYIYFLINQVLTSLFSSWSFSLPNVSLFGFVCVWYSSFINILHICYTKPIFQIISPVLKDVTSVLWQNFTVRLRNVFGLSAVSGDKPT